MNDMRENVLVRGLKVHKLKKIFIYKCLKKILRRIELKFPKKNINKYLYREI